MRIGFYAEAGEDYCFEVEVPEHKIRYGSLRIGYHDIIDAFKYVTYR